MNCLNLGKCLIAVLCLLCSAASAATWTLERGWLSARDGETPLLQATDGPAATVDVNDKAFPSGAAPATRQDGAALEAVYTQDGGELADRYEPFPKLGPDAWLRTLTYTNRSNAPQDLTAAKMRLAPVRLAQGMAWNPRWFWMTEAAPGRAVCLSYKGSGDYYHIDGDANWTGHAVEAAWRLAPGQQAVIGAQGIWLGAVGREEFRAEARRWYAAIDLHIPTDSPAWLNDTILYECSAGGHIDSRFSDVGGFDRLATQAEYLAGLGITAVWLQAVHKHKSPPDPLHGGWNLYDPLDMLAVDDILGGPKALKRLTKSFRKQDLRVLGELVPHGGHSVQALALPQWWTAGRDGKPSRNWGGCGMDYSSPEWQAVQRDVATMLAREFGMVGARIDVADGSGVNWTSPRTNHASYSTLAGSVEMLRAIHEGFAKDGVSPLIIPENGNFPEHFAVSPIAYGHSTWMVLARELPAMKQEPARMVTRLREFFETERGSYPPGGRVLRTLNNHDSVCENGRVQYRYGAGLARALYGVCLMIEGIPMLYQEEEVGSYDALRALNLARRSIPEFAAGDPDYLSIDFAPEVFACLRNGDGAYAVGLSNLSGKTISGTVALPIP
ncbi:MAG: alpha-amylase family glycosyl hydrolase, partial [FCB group bacterium]|nr:alpha-amylase family glycosyl hydrolase [FCB group bacterium]